MAQSFSPSFIAMLEPPNDPTSTWPHPQILPGLWRDLDLADACALLARLSAQELSDGLEPSAWAVIYRYARALRLELFPNWLLVEAEALLPNGETGCCYFFYGPKRRLLPVRWQMDTLNILDAINRRAGVAIQPSPDYLRLRVNLVAAENSRFAIIESPADLPLLPGAVCPEDVARHIKPLRIHPEKIQGVTVAEGYVLYQSQIFDSTIRVHPSGYVELEDRAKLGVVPVCLEDIRGMFRILRASPFRVRGEDNSTKDER